MIPFLQEIIEYRSGSSPSYETLQDAFQPNGKTRQSTIDFFDLGIVQSIHALPIMQEEDRMVPAYGCIFNLACKLCDYLGELYPNILPYREHLKSFPHLVSALLWVEETITSLPQDSKYGLLAGKGPFESYSTHGFSLPASKQPSEWTDTDSKNIILNHALMLYIACFELDSVAWKTCIKIESPQAYLPRVIGKTLRGPLWIFWDALKRFSACSSWPEFADIVGEDEQCLRNWANAKTLKRCPSWHKLTSMLDSLNLKHPNLESGDVNEDRIRFQWAYAFARILHEHVRIIQPTLEKLELMTPEWTLFANKMIDTIKRNECRRIPLHPWFQ